MTEGVTRPHDDGDPATILEAGTEAGRVVVLWGDGHRSAFHPVWLRHARFFPAFPDRDRGDESFLPPDRPGEIAAAAVEVTAGGDLRVTWAPAGPKPGPVSGSGPGSGPDSGPGSVSEDDVSEFEAAWLRARCCAASERARRRRPLRLWDAAIAADPPLMSYETARGGDAGRLALYRLVLDHGFAILQGVPARSGEVAGVGELFGRLRPSPYATFGDGGQIEDVRVDPSVGVSTRMSHLLGPHSDTCWRTAVVGLVCLHCLAAAADGGETILVDGFAAAERLRARDPEAFALLSRVPLNFAASVDNGDEWRALGRVISVDAEGTVVGFRYNDKSIVEPDLPEDLIEPAYAALGALERVLYDPGLWLRRKLAPGDCVVIDNQRVLHGRGRFEPETGGRHLQTCHLERDEFHNNFRRLARAMGETDWNQTLPWGLC